jgi:hypothetical protein
MFVEDAIILEGKVSATPPDIDGIDESEKGCVCWAFADLIPEAFFDYQTGDGRIERRLNPYLLGWTEIVKRISALPAKQRQGRIRKEK